MGEGFLYHRLLGNEVWRYLAVGFVVVSVLVAYPVIRSLIRHHAASGEVGRRAAARGVLLRLMQGSLPLLVFWAASRVFLLPSQAQAVLEGTFKAIWLVFVLYLVMKLVDLGMIAWEARARRTESTLDDALVPLVRRSLKGFIFGIGVLLFLQNVLRYDITSLLAGLGIGGLAVAFAAQDAIANLFGAVMIFADRPFKVGDAVSLEGFEGKIEAIGLRSTRLRTWEGTLVTIPNRAVAAASITNLAEREMRVTTFVVRLAPSTQTARVEEAVAILRDVLSRHPSTGMSRAYFRGPGEASLEVFVQHGCRHLDYEPYLRALEEIHLETKRRFEAAGIEVAFPLVAPRPAGAPPRAGG